MSGRNRRQHERMDVCLDVELVHPNVGRISVKTRDLSHGGLFVVMAGDLPPVGSVVKVKLLAQLGEGAEPPTVTMRVVRLESEGMGLMFVDERPAD